LPDKMKTSILRVEIRYEQDVVLCRQRARQIAGLLGFRPQGQVHIATAVSEIARNAFRYAGGGQMEFFVESEPTARMCMVLTDQGPGIPNLQTIFDGKYASKTGMGLGIVGAKRLMDQFLIETTSKGTKVVLEKAIAREKKLNPSFLAELTKELSRQTSEDPFAEVQQQNQELLAAFSELEQRQNELTRVNLELEQAKRELTLHNEHLESRVSERTAELKASLNQMERFCYSIAHDLKAPLRAINGWTIMLREDYEPAFDEAGKNCTARIVEAATRMDLLIADLLEYGQLTHMEVESSSINLTQEIEKVLQGLREEITSLKATVEVQKDLPNIFANPVLLRQALSNLIENGLKFVKKGVLPNLMIWAEGRSKQTKAGNLVPTTRIWIKDNGIGIAAVSEERIFKVFQRLHGEHSAYPGTGIGLALVQKAIERMNGTVGVESDDGKGSRFWIELPNAA
jgi:signal transduction histidine kinase